MTSSTDPITFYSILILGFEDILQSSLVSKLLKDAATYGSKNVVLKVISPRGTPNYIEQLRNLLLSNIYLSITVEYAGSDLEDIKKLVERLHKHQGTAVKVYVFPKARREFLDVLRDLGVTYDVVGEG